MYGQGPRRIPRDNNERLLERLKSLEARLAGVERRGSSATWNGVSVPGHSVNHITGGNDELLPSDIGAATQADMTAAEGDISALESSVLALPGKYAETIIGDGTDTTFTINHELGTRDCLVVIREVASPYAQVQPADYAIEYTDSDNILITWDTAPASAAEYRVIVVG